jgi:signal transduction histidine kinase
MIYPLWGVGIITAAVLLLLTIPLAVAVSWNAATQTGLGVLVGIIFIIIYTRIAAREFIARLEVERLAGELREANQKLREYAVQAEELATTQERNRLAREIHDSLGHYLTVVNVQLEAAKTVLAHDPDRALSAIEKAQTLTKNGLADVRRSVAALRASPLDNVDLPEAIEPLLDECRSGGLSAQLAITGTPVVLDPHPKLTLYRVIQEGLTNVQKHAQAGQVDITLDYSTPGVVHMTIADDGKGITEPDETEGFGLLGIGERVKLLGGNIETRSEPGEGFVLSVGIPFTTGEAVTNGND